MRRPVQAEVQPLHVRAADASELPDEHRCCRTRAGRPTPGRLVAALPGRADQAILLERVDDLLEPEDVGLERAHVGEQQRQPLVPAVGEVADVERRDVQAVHAAQCAVSGDRGGGQRRTRTSTRPLLRLDPDPTAVLLDDVPRDRQPEARAAAARTRARSTL